MFHKGGCKLDTHSSIRRKISVFSIVLFLVILIGGSIAFAISMWQIDRINASNELVKATEIERTKLEASVNGEIAIALKMADSPLIKRHFLNTEDDDLRRIAFEEIEGYRQAFASKSVFWASDKNKEFYFSENDHYTLDPNDPDTYWYKMTLYETVRYNFNINYNAELKKVMLWINAPVFDGKTPIGLVGTGIGVSDFVNAIYQNYSGDATMYFYNNLGEITGAKDNISLVTDKVTLDKHLDNVGMEILDRTRNLKPGEFTFFNTPGGVIAIGEITALEWYIAAILPITFLDSMNSAMTVIFFAMMAIIALIFIIFYFFIIWLLNPLGIMVTTLNQISADWNLTHRLEISRKDETGTLADFFNLTFDKISGLVKAIKNKTFNLSDTGDELNATMNETSESIQKIDDNIQSMRGIVLSQADEVNSSAKSMERIMKGLDGLNDHITLQANMVAQSSSAIEQMLANIHSVTETLIRNTSNINSLAESSEAGQKDLQKVSEDIKEISRESEGLLEINSVMQNIASQTNLLSMNAAIEAAHAGESGKGFAVVADEIRKLAENSGKQSKTISTVLKKIKTSIDAITRSNSTLLERFGIMQNEVETVSNMESQIRNAMQEQETGSHQILDAVTKLNSVSGEVQHASSDMISITREVLKQSNNLKQISNDVAGGMDDMTQNADAITIAVKRVLEISQENKENIDNLSSDIALFKVE
jgi:methyl-accepting chemotaxis protein